MSHMQRFAQIVAQSFQTLTKDANVFVADIDGDALYATYLAAFPEGTNPMFKTRTEHDCSCCRHFIRRAGVVVTIGNGKVRTVWDDAASEAPVFFGAVATSLAAAVRSAGVRDVFRVGKNESSFGAVQTHSLDKVTQLALVWNHLHTGTIPRDLRVEMPDADRGAYRTKGPRTTKPRAGSTTSFCTRALSHTVRSSRSSRTKPSADRPKASSQGSASHPPRKTRSSYARSRARSSDCSTFASAHEPTSKEI